MKKVIKIIVMTFVIISLCIKPSLVYASISEETEAYNLLDKEWLFQYKYHTVFSLYSSSKSNNEVKFIGMLAVVNDFDEPIYAVQDMEGPRNSIGLRSFHKQHFYEWESTGSLTAYWEVEEKYRDFKFAILFYPYNSDFYYSSSGGLDGEFFDYDYTNNNYDLKVKTYKSNQSVYFYKGVEGQNIIKSDSDLGYLFDYNLPFFYYENNLNETMPFYVRYNLPGYGERLLVSKGEIFVNNDGFLHASDEYAYFINNDSLPVSSGGRTKVENRIIPPRVGYSGSPGTGVPFEGLTHSNHMIYKTNVPDDNTDFPLVKQNATDQLIFGISKDERIETSPKIYPYRYSSEIPNVEGLLFNRTRISLGKFQEYVAWDIPQVEGLSLEVNVSVDGNTARYQTFKEYPYTNSTKYSPYALAYNGRWEVNQTDLFYKLTANGKIPFILDSDKYLDTIYLRYVKINEEKKTIDYGNWTRMSLQKFGDMNIIDKSISNIIDEDGQKIEGTLTTENTVSPIVSEENSRLDYEQLQNEDLSLKEGVNSIYSIGNMLMDLPQLLGSFFSFFPIEFNLMLTASLALIIILRVIGR